MHSLALLAVLVRRQEEKPGDDKEPKAVGSGENVHNHVGLFIRKHRIYIILNTTKSRWVGEG